MADKKIENLTLSDAFKELEGISEKFEKGELDLEEGIKMFERGKELALHLKSKISTLENDIQEIKNDLEKAD